MPIATFITTDGREIAVEQSDGTLMEAAFDWAVEGIDADCGGVCSCGTCHVKIRADWLARVGPASEIESEVLDQIDHADERSRLSCQIHLTDALDGIVVEVATKPC